MFVTSCSGLNIFFIILYNIYTTKTRALFINAGVCFMKELTTKPKTFVDCNSL
jgi:hypothetical protein